MIEEVYPSLEIRIGGFVDGATGSAIVEYFGNFAQKMREKKVCC